MKKRQNEHPCTGDIDEMTKMAFGLGMPVDFWINH